jgi:CBS domain-containing protein
MEAPMFSIYGMAGRVFSGPLEQMQRVRGLDAVRRAGAVGPSDPGFRQALQAAGDDGDAPRRPALPPGTLGAAYSQTSPAHRQRLTSVGELMSHPPFCLDGALPARQAWQNLAERRVGQAPVVDAAGQLVGLVLRADLPPGPEVADPASAWLQPVAAHMRTPVAAVSPDTDVRRVAQVLLDTGLPGLPVVDDQGRVLGFLARSDILRAVAHDPPLDLWA